MFFLISVFGLLPGFTRHTHTHKHTRKDLSVSCSLWCIKMRSGMRDFITTHSYTLACKHVHSAAAFIHVCANQMLLPLLTHTRRSLLAFSFYPHGIDLPFNVVFITSDSFCPHIVHHLCCQHFSYWWSAVWSGSSQRVSFQHETCFLFLWMTARVKVPKIID